MKKKTVTIGALLLAMNSLLKAREIYNQTNGLQNISEHELKKFNELMKYGV